FLFLRFFIYTYLGFLGRIQLRTPPPPTYTHSLTKNRNQESSLIFPYSLTPYILSITDSSQFYLLKFT
ncbi:unnamed protein product, partial [Gulo gulo]